ncbi:MAG: hypothetical protein KBG20_00510 [Caldilineaceae bacterium]|nr:hypothetical protein [Caldilineaceae bacterium]MBP8108105.1 hypothetical protein [Caldilineaceae bacterium]MBP8123093.1 hypothetical protein [Caldilineaceae bacterium]MBP9070740.1 hypothetical protein [Caldilineaceae bacterium]
MKPILSVSKRLFRFALLPILFVVCFMAGSMVVAGLMPTHITSEPGLVPATTGLMIIALADVLVIAALILTSRWHGWKLALSLALAYYGAVTFVMQIETAYFLSSITVSPQLLPRLFVMGMPTAFVFIPLAVWILGKGKASVETSAQTGLTMPIGQWLWKLNLASMFYVILYWGAGYFIAWQNPALRAFYGQPGDALPFFVHTVNTLRSDPWLFPFQSLRTLLWVLCSLPVIWGSKVNPWWTALLVGLLFSVPQNVGHILANPLLPVASIRMSHLIETASSTFVFGLLVVWIFHRAHDSFGDLIGIKLDVSGHGRSIQFNSQSQGNLS